MSDLPPARILYVSPGEYHRLPGLSPSTAHQLYTRCAAIARDRYVQSIGLPVVEDDSDGDHGEVSADKQAQLDRGDILHSLLLGIGKRIEVIPTSALSKNGTYGTDKAKALRDGARAAGMVPVKEAKMAAYERAAAVIRDHLRDAGHVLDGESEVAIEWWERSEHGPVQCRTMLDHLVLLAADGLQVAIGKPPVHITPARAKVFELKLPGDASPDRSERTADGLGYPVAAAARLRALNALFPSLAGRIEYRFLLCESTRPYAFWDPEPTGSFLEYGARVWRAAVSAWGAGLKSDRWPGYHDDIMRRQIDLPRWRKMAEGFADDE